MCGIAAIFNYGRRQDMTQGISWLQAANQLLRKRGPDGQGWWLSKDKTIGLTHRRLGIIDPTPNGAQPMATPDGRLRIVFNGEIYNYKKLKQNLITSGHRFHSNSDTEVLLHLYRENGINFIHRLRGMFALALWDDTEQGLLLARDPLGIKPLYYSDSGHTIRIASQVKTILAAGGVDTSPEPAGHVGFFLWGHVPEPFTLFKGIRCLPAGSTLWITKHSPASGPRIYYRLSEQMKNAGNGCAPLNKTEAKDRLKAVLEDSVKHHLVADVPVGLFLSAGIDSTAIASLAACQSDRPLKSFTLGFDQYKGTINDETVWAERVAHKFKCQHETHWMSLEAFARELPSIFTNMDQPSIDGINTYFVSKAAAQSGLKVVLSGLGGDELLGGYPSFSQIPVMVRVIRHVAVLGKAFRVASAPFLRCFTSPKYAGVIEYGGTWGGAYLLRRGLFMPWELPDILDPDMVNAGMRMLNPISSLNDEVEKLPSNHHRVAALETIGYMRNTLLRDTDWAGMAHSLEIRVPLVDVKVLQDLSPLMGSKKNFNKKTMAQAVWEKIPTQLLNRPKTGFCFPTQEWTSDNTKERGLRGWARVIFNEVSNHLPTI